MVEIYKDIVGYEGLYKVSNFGNVMSFWGKTPKLLKPRNNGKGYLFVGLSNHNKPRKNFYLHRLVAQAFLTNPNNYPVINHKDENKLNNNVSNLEFCTQQYNLKYGSHYERVSKALYKPVLQFSKNGNFVNEYPSIKDAKIKTGIDESNIGKVCKGKLNSAGGFLWKYKQS